ncbi:hypothetical protein ABT340_04890 [Streptosporangium sp. NPDC000239]|uniref:hypothetical protein n=1 Tax=Streptosporangium sp. NPDC000239 TaxID=3154248 RepID=UPI00331E1605
MLLALVTIALWILSAAYVALDALIPGHSLPIALHHLLLAASATVTLAWILRHPRLQYRVGYRDGYADAERNT